MLHFTGLTSERLRTVYGVSFRSRVRVVATKGPHSILGLFLDASVEGIKSAYCALGMQFHPDRNPEGLERMKAINAAYAALEVL
jgi:DnaJ-class molecular chaperone